MLERQPIAWRNYDDHRRATGTALRLRLFQPTPRPGYAPATGSPTPILGNISNRKTTPNPYNTPPHQRARTVSECA